MGANPHANGGLLLRDARAARLPRLRGRRARSPARRRSEATRVLGAIPARRDARRTSTTSASSGPTRPRPTGSARVFEVTDRSLGGGRSAPTTTTSRRDGRVMEVLSEHMCQGWLEGYLLTGRHGLFSCYEAFIHIVDSMFNQHAKWLKVTRGIPWRAPIASLNYLLTSHVWRQDHNGFSHQDPGFIDHVVNKKAEVVRVYLPPDANSLLSVADHCLRSAQLRQRDRRRQAAGAQWLTSTRRSRTARAGSGSGSGRAATTAQRAGRRAGLRRRRPDAGDARRGGAAARARSRTCASASSTSST